MKTLKFRAFKAQWVLDGTKTSSLRLFDEKDIQEGDDLELIDWDTGRKFANAKVTEVIEKSLNDLTSGDLEGHEDLGSKEAMLKTLKKYYGERVTMATMAKVVRFKVLRTQE